MSVSEMRKSLPGSQIDVAVRLMLPEHVRCKEEDFDAKAVHDMDTKYVQTVASEMAEGDTLILINVPKCHRPNRGCSGAYFPLSYRLRFPSGILRSCGFGLFPRLLDDAKYQAKSRWRLASRETIPEGIEYFLDLGPSADEDLQSAHLETLTLSKGLARWYRTEFVPPKINQALVAGHDDCCECISSNLESPVAAEPLVGCLWDRAAAEPWFRCMIEDYCEVRHAANVVRLLRKIRGRFSGALVLDSAPRVFTIVGLAKLFEMHMSDQSSWLRDAVLTWFLADGNCEIMEILAEDAIIMGYGVQIPEIARASYRVLVAEHALQLESCSPAPPGGHKYSVFGRPLRDINNDTIQTAIEHGGQALLERVLDIRNRLLSDNVFDWLRCDEWDKLSLLATKLELTLSKQGPSDGLAAIEKACRMLKETLVLFVRDRVSDASKSYETENFEFYDNNLSHFVPQNQKIQFSDRWSGLNSNQRTLTSIFWKNLGSRWPNTVHNSACDDYPLISTAGDLNAALDEHGFALDSYVPEYFDIHRLFLQLEHAIDQNVCRPMWDVHNNKTEHTELQHLFISSHMLLGLNENEMRFLPLWAGGLNDDSGGVYDSSIPPPPSNMGPSGPGPSYHTGQTVGTETTNSTVGDLGFGNMEIISYTTATRTDLAHRGPSSVGPSAGGPGASEDMDFDDARYVVPACHQAIGQAVARTVQAAEDDDDDDSMMFNPDDEDHLNDFDTPTASVTDLDTDHESEWSMT